MRFCAKRRASSMSPTPTSLDLPALRAFFDDERSLTMMIGKRQSSTTFIQPGKHLERQWLTLTSILIQPSPKRFRMPLVMKCSAFLVAIGRPIVSRTVCCRCFSSLFLPLVPHARPISRIAMLRYLSIRSKDDQEFFVEDEIFESEKPPQP